MNKLQIEYFLTICKYMSFTEAARVLYVSQPAVSKQISALEREIGLPLFERTYRTLHLTQSGKIFHDAFQKIEIIYTDALREAVQCSTQSKESLLVGAPSGWIVSKLLPPRLMGKMKADYPSMSCSVHHLAHDELYRELRQNSLDAIFVYQFDCDDGQKDLASSVAKEVNLRLFYCSRQRDSDTEHPLKQFAGEPFYLCPELKGDAIPERLSKFCSTLGFEPNIVNAPNIESAISSVEVGFGGVVVLDELHKLAGNSKFQYIDLPVSTKVCLVWKRNAQNPISTLLVNELRSSLDCNFEEPPENSDGL